jgi:hypothetical protein
MYPEKGMRAKVKKAISGGHTGELEDAINLIWRSENPTVFSDLLAQLLIVPGHQSHQEIAKFLQDHSPDPIAIPYVRIALSDLDYLSYTGSD